MRLVIFSDIHGNQYAMRSFLKQIVTIPYDRIIFCGDIFGYYYGQEEIIRKMLKIDKLIWLRGNHDQYAVDLYDRKAEQEFYVQKYGHCYDDIVQKYAEENINLFRQKPCDISIDVEGKRIGIFHGTPNMPLEGRLYPKDEITDEEAYNKYDYVILGHTHFRMDRTIGDTRIINPGSLGQQRDGRGCGYAVLDTKKDILEYHDITYDRASLYEEIDHYDKALEKLKTILEREL